MIIGVDGCGKRQRESGKGRVVCVHVYMWMWGRVMERVRYVMHYKF